MKTRISIFLVIVLLLSLMGACAQNESLVDSTSGLSGNDSLSELGAVGNVGEERTPESLTPAEQYLRDVIMPDYDLQINEVSTTYYCQTYGGTDAGGIYSTISGNYYFDLQNMKPWLLAYNIADYNADGIEDIFTISLNYKSDLEIGEVKLNKAVYLMDNDGNGHCRCWDTTYLNILERKMVFAFIDDNLIEFVFMDHSSKSTGKDHNSIDYPVTSEIWGHSDTLSLITFDAEKEELNRLHTFSRNNKPNEPVSYEVDGITYQSGSESIALFQTALSENNIPNVEISLSGSWEERWNNLFYISDLTEYNAVFFETSPTISEQCFNVAQIELRDDGKTALNTTSGTIVLHSDIYEGAGSITAPKEEEPMAVSTETNTQGQYALGFCQGWPGLFVRYSDGSFDRYNGGAVLTWDESYMTYGTDNFPRDLVISMGTIESNAKKLAEGELVLFWPYDNRVRSGLYKVVESGYSLVRKDEDGDLEGLFITRLDESGTGFAQWNQGEPFYWLNKIKYSTINGVSKELYEDFPSAEGREYASFPTNQKFTIGVTEGTTLVEKEYFTDYMYLIQSDESSNYQQTATVDGYAVLDFSDTEPGEYIFTVSYWNEDRRVREVISTYVIID